MHDHSNPDLIQDGRRLVTNSEVNTWKDCRRKWWIASHRGLRPKGDEEQVTGARVIGTRVHVGLQVWYTPGEHQFDDEYALAAYDELVADDAARAAIAFEDEDETVIPDGFYETSILGRIILEGYFDWARETGEDADLEVIDAEVEMHADINEDLRLIGKFDLFVQRISDGAFRFIDHKTTGGFDGLIVGSQLNPQFKHYALIQLLTLPEGERADGGIFNMLRKVKRTLRAKPPFYARHEVRYNELELQNHLIDIVSTMRDIKDAEDRLAAGESHQSVVPKSPGAACNWCGIKSFCPMFDDGSDAEGMLEELMEQANPIERYDLDVEETEV